MHKDDVKVIVKAPVTRSWWIAVVAAFWLMSAVAGLWVIWTHENKPGVPAQSPAQWPAETPFRLAADRPGSGSCFVVRLQAEMADAAAPEVPPV